jgi:hypothetical protein
MNRSELVMRRRNVRAFVDADPVDVVLMRPSAKVRTSAGGWVEGEPLPLPPQRGRIVQAKRRFASPLVNTEAGEVTELPYILLGFWDMDVEKGDYFDWNNARWEVKSISDDREERTVVAVEYHGKIPAVI